MKGKGGTSSDSKDTHAVGSQSDKAYALWRITFTWKEPREENIITWLVGLCTYIDECTTSGDVTREKDASNIMNGLAMPEIL